MQSKSAIHEILGAIAFGMGILSIALGIAVMHLAAIRLATEKQAEALEAVRNRQPPVKA